MALQTLTPRRSLGIIVFDEFSSTVTDAHVTIEPIDPTPHARSGITVAVYDPVTARYTATIESIEARIRVDHPDFESQTLLINLDYQHEPTVFILGRSGSTYTFVSGIRHPYPVIPDEIGVVVDPEVVPEEIEPDAETGATIRSVDNENSAESVLQEISRERRAGKSRGKGSALKSFVVKVGDIDAPNNSSANSKNIASKKDDQKRDHPKREPKERGSKAELLRQLRADARIHAAGPIFRKHDDGAVDVITNVVTVQFRPDITEQRAAQILEETGLGDIERIEGTLMVYTAVADPSIDKEINDLLEELNWNRLVLTASAVVSGEIKYAQVIPNDPLWDSQWDKVLARVHFAWELLRDAPAVGHRFGDPRLVAAVDDSGIESGTGGAGPGVPSNVEFQLLTTGGATATLVAPGAGPQRSQIVVADISGIAIGNRLVVGDERGLLVHARDPVTRQVTIDPLTEPHFRNERVRVGDAPGAFITVLDGDVAAAESNFTVTYGGAERFHEGDTLSIGVQGTVGEEHVRVLEAVGTAIRTTAVRGTHGGGVAVVSLRKMKLLRNFVGNVPTNDALENGSSHGTRCAGILGAKADNGVGLAGAAPDIRLIGLRMNYTGYSTPAFDAPGSNQYRWIAGLTHYESDPANPFVPAVQYNGADIISVSRAYDFISMIIQNLFDHLTRRGRDNRGTLAFYAAANENRPQPATYWSSYSRTFSCGATWLDRVTAGGTSFTREQRAGYSNFSLTRVAGAVHHTNGEVDFSAPSGHHFQNEWNGHDFYGIQTTTLIGRGNLPGAAAVTTTLAADSLFTPGAIAASRRETSLVAGVLAGAPYIIVDNVAIFAVGDWVRLGQSESTPIEWVQVAAVVPAENRLTLSAVAPAALPAVPRVFNNLGADFPTTVSRHAGATVNVTDVEIDIPSADPIWGPTVPGGPLFLPLPFVIEIGGVFAVVNAIRPGSIVGSTIVTLQSPLPAAPPPAPAPVVAVRIPAAVNNADRQVVLGSDIQVASNAGFVAGRWITIDDGTVQDGNKKYEAAHVQSVWTNAGTGANMLRISGPTREYDVGAGLPVVTIRQGAADYDYTNRFNGTSAAAPLLAGIGALVLSAKPSLTWVETRHIMRDTAAIIDLPGRTVNIAGVPTYEPWVDFNNDPITSAAPHRVHRFSGTTAVRTTPAAGEARIDLDSVAMFRVGHKVRFGALGSPTTEVFTVLEIDALNRRIIVDPVPTHIHTGSTVVTTSVTTIAAPAAAAGATAITVVDAFVFAEGQAIEITDAGTTFVELGAVRRIVDATHIELHEPLVNALAVGNNIVGGRHPYKSRLYGYGRVDAEMAVRAALAYDHDERDLIIRNDIADDGVADTPVTTPVHSPDIWLRNIAPGVDGAAAVPAGYGTLPLPHDASYSVLPPHQNPSAATERHVYARVKNRGTEHDSLFAEVRIYLHRTRRLELFRLTRWWDDNAAIGTFSQGEGTWLLGTRQLYDAPVNDNLPALNGGSGGIRPNGNFIAKVAWPLAATPALGLALDLRQRTYLIAEITPQDGEYSGPDMRRNHNISLREVTFARVTFRQDATTALPLDITVPRSRFLVPPDQNFRIEVVDEHGYFRTDKVKVVIRRLRTDAGWETVTYEWTGTAWGSDDPVQTWVSVNAPVDLASGTAAAYDADRTNLLFTGVLNDLTGSFERVELKVLIFSHLDALMLEETHVIALTTNGHSYNQLRFDPVDDARVHFFSEVATITQTTALTYGAKSGARYRVTSGFTAATAPKAYAAANGVVFVQRQMKADGTGYDPDRVNLILKPLDSTKPGSVRYFVYRGIKLTDLFKGNAGTDLEKLRDRTGGSELIEAMYDVHQALWEAQGNTGTPPDPPHSKSLGWDPATQADADSLDDYFRERESEYQLFPVRFGTYLGDFHHAVTTMSGTEILVEFGFEIVLEDSTFPRTFAYARAPFYEVVAPIDPDASTVLRPEDIMDDRFKRHEVLDFIDPAAYFGDSAARGVFTRVGLAPISDPKKGDEVYTDVLYPFVTRNVIYIDIRNENGYAFDYYNNYNPNGGQIRTEHASPGSYSERRYGTVGWPIIAEYREPGVNKPTAGDHFVLAVPSGEEIIPLLVPQIADNQQPAAYIENSVFDSGSGDVTFLDSSRLVIAGDHWTRDLRIRIPQFVETATGKHWDVATRIKLYFFREVDPTPVWLSDKTVRFTRYTDNLFGPVIARPSWTTGSNPATTWFGLADRKYVDGVWRPVPMAFFATVAERGIAYETNRVIYFLSAIAYPKIPGGGIPQPLGTSGGFSTERNFLEATSLFDRYRLVTKVIQETISSVLTSIPLYSLEALEQNVVPEGVLILGISEANNTLLQTAAATLSPSHDVNLILEPIAPPVGKSHHEYGSGSSRIEYDKYLVKVRGLHKDTLESTDVPPSSPITVYTANGLIFTGLGFTMPTLKSAVSCSGSPEELVAIGDPTKPTLMTKLRANVVMALNTDVDGDGTTMKTIVENFETALNAVGVADPTALTQLNAIVDNYAGQILEESQTNWATVPHIVPNDTPLYWARLAMQYALKNHAYTRANTEHCAELSKRLEGISRGYPSWVVQNGNTGPDFTPAGPGVKKILLTGFDPYGGGTTNPSGVIALALHGATVSDGVRTGYIQSMIIPVRYDDFDYGLVGTDEEGLIAELVRTYLHDPLERVSMLMSISQNGPHWYFDIERFAGRFRGGGRDNNGHLKTPGNIGTGAAWRNHYETTLPFTPMMSGITLATPPVSKTDGQIVFFDQSYAAAGASTPSVGHPELGGPNTTTATVTPPDPIHTMQVGSGGDYLSNEIFYRIAHIREKGGTSPSPTKTGHLHVPSVAASGLSNEDIIIQTRDLIVNSLVQLP